MTFVRRWQRLPLSCNRQRVIQPQIPHDEFSVQRGFPQRHPVTTRIDGTVFKICTSNSEIALQFDAVSSPDHVVDRVRFHPSAFARFRQHGARPCSGLRESSGLGGRQSREQAGNVAPIGIRVWAYAESAPAEVDDDSRIQAPLPHRTQFSSGQVE